MKKMRLMYFLAIVVIVMVACNKDKSDNGFSAMPLQGPFTGVWVESSMRKDTINFNVNQAMIEQVPTRPPSNAGVFVMGSEKYKVTDGSYKSPGGIYSYYRKEDSLFLYNFYSSSINYSGFKFKLTTDSESQNFVIERFYERPELNEEITFIRVR